MVTRILPMLNRLIPQNLAMKGLAKINPRIGSFLTNVTAAGYSVNEALDFLRNQAEPIADQGLRPDELAAAKRVQQGNLLPQALGAAAKAGIGAGAISAIPTVIGNMFQGQPGQGQQTPGTPSQQTQQQSQQQAQNIIAQYSPELASFLEGHIQQGRDPLQAGALAQLDPKFKRIIAKIEADHQASWSDILQSLFGGQQVQASQPQQGAPRASQAAGQAQQAQGGNNTDQAIMAALDKIFKK